MKRILLSLAVVLAATGALAQTDPGSHPLPIYENFGVVDTAEPAPQIDAFAFANYGQFSVSTFPGIFEFPYTVRGWIPLATQAPYDFQNVLNYTNTGFMSSLTGFQFDTVSTNGQRRPADTIVNRAGANILGQLRLLMTADSIQNQGILETTAFGTISLKGDDVNLNRGGLLVTALPGGGSFGCFFGGAAFTTPTNFIPDFGIRDLYWALGTNNGFNVSQFLNLNPDGSSTVNGGLFLSDARSFIRTNAVTPTNWIVQGIFIQNQDPRVFYNARYYPSTIPTNAFQTASVELRSFETNVVTGDLIIHSVYLVDYLASETNYVLLTNLTVVGSYMPSPYRVSRTPACEFTLGSPPNTIIRSNLFYGTECSIAATNVGTNVFTNSICIGYPMALVTNINASYGAGIDTNASSLTPPTLQGSVSNIVGRVEIDAETLDLRRTRIRTEGMISVKTDHLIGSAGAIVDSPDLNYELGTQTGTLVVTNLTKISVERFGGNVFLWSAVWTNNLEMAITNYAPDPMDPTLIVTNMFTNVVEVGFHVFLVDSQISTSGQGVRVHNFVTHGDNVIVGDVMNITERIFTDAESFTLAGSINLARPILNWGTNISPNVVNFTNSGSLSLIGLATFGPDRGDGTYENFINSGGLIQAEGIKITTANFDNSGFLFAGLGGIGLTADSAKAQGGQLNAGGDIRVIADSFKLRNYSQIAYGNYFTVSGSLSDSGFNSGNVIESSGGGVHFLIKPDLGDLFGTTVRSTAPRFVNARNSFAGEDRGATVEGFTNNLVIGRLELDGSLESLQTLEGTDDRNGLYVDFLDLSGEVLRDLENALEISDNLIVYFADSNVPVEQLDGMFDGRLRWVKEFAGPNSSVEVLGPVGQTLRMNRALRESTSIDSDGDGIVNRLDLTPLGGLALTGVSVNLLPSPEATISWQGKAGAIYELEYATSLSPANWRSLVRYTNTAKTDGVVSVKEPIQPGQSQRFYRVRLISQ